MTKNLVVKSNRLNTAIQNLSLTEVRIMQLAIIDARDTGTGLTTDRPLVISSARYAEAFNVSRQTAYEAILSAEKNLFERRFSFLDIDEKIVKSRWVQRVKYLNDEASIEIILTYDVVNEITRIDGYEQFFTKYLLKQTASMKSAYSVRLYELLIQWLAAKKTPVFELFQFREQLGVSADEYSRMFDFKSRVLNVAIDEINELTDIKVNYEQEKRGKRIIGFKFKIASKDKRPGYKRDDNKTAIFKMTDKQRELFAVKLAKMSELSHLAKQGEDYKQFANRIKSDLLSEKKRAFYIPYLEKLEFH